jgi:hypothetical protein
LREIVNLKLFFIFGISLEEDCCELEIVFKNKIINNLNESGSQQQFLGEAPFQIG